jgi:ABC-type transport system involved in multi-copper enzyme maturation permease subunit
VAGFVPSFGRALRGTLPGRKLLVLFVFLLIPAALQIASGVLAPEKGASPFFFIVFFLYLQFLVPLCALLFGTEILLAEASGGTLPYLFTRPVPRFSIILGKYAAYLVAGSVALALSIAATVAAGRGPALPDGLAGRALLAVLASYPAYLGAFSFLSAFTRWSLMAGFLYAFGVEFFLGIIPGMVRKGTVLYYSRSLFGEWDETPRTLRFFFAGDEPSSLSGALTTLGAIALVGLILSAVIVRRRQFVERNPGRA